MKSLLSFILAFQSWFLVNAQIKLGNTWVTGNMGHRIEFNNSGIITSDPYPINTTIFNGGNSNICDTLGHLLLQSDGLNIYNKLGVLVEEGDTMTSTNFYIQEAGWSTYQQSSIFLPIDSGKYYFINATMSDARLSDCFTNSHCSFDLLYYSVVDANANNGQGAVIKKLVPIMENADLSKTQMMACKHSNGKDWWLLKQGSDSNTVYTFLITKDSIYDYGKQSFLQPVWGKMDIMGQSMFNPEGTLYITTVHGDGGGNGLVALSKFDRCYGVLDTPQVLLVPQLPIPSDTNNTDYYTTGLCFSPNGRFIYVSTIYHIFQYDLNDMTWYTVADIDTTTDQFCWYRSICSAPNDKLYIGYLHGIAQQWSVIDNPDVKGTGCGFCRKCLRLDTLSWGYIGTPPCMPNYSLGAKTCWPLSVGSMSVTTDWSFDPNPAYNHISVRNAVGKRKMLYDGMGQVILSTTNDELDITNLKRGIYFLFCDGMAKKVIID